MTHAIVLLGAERAALAQSRHDLEAMFSLGQ